MEEFKQLKWSWLKNEDERDYLPRNFNFDNLNSRDPFSRNLNEVHLSVLPQHDGYRLYKTPEEIATNSFVLESTGDIAELKDPRKISSKIMKASGEMIKEYQYKSELKQHEHLCILAALNNNAIHNPKLIRKAMKYKEKYLLDKLKEKWENEVCHFNKSAEFYYYNHINELNDLLDENVKKYLIEKWNTLERALFLDYTFQIITAIIQTKANQLPSISVEHVQDLSKEFKKNLFEVPENFFPNLSRFSTDSLKLFDRSRIKYDKLEVESCIQYDCKISLEVLSKLFTSAAEYSVMFENVSDNATGKIVTNFLSHEALPPKTVDQESALKDALKTNILSQIEWSNAEKCIETSSHSEEEISFKSHKINDLMSKIFLNYRKKSGCNVTLDLWKLQRESRSFSILLSDEAFYTRNDVAINISVKLEYQTIFGAETMTKNELLAEYLALKLKRNSLVLRYRVDAKSLTILSIIYIDMKAVEEELKRLYDYDPHESIDILLNTLCCINKLPPNVYLIEARNENDCHKLKIFKATEELNRETNEEFQICANFSRKFIQIDHHHPTHISINHNIAPSCFSHYSFKVSYAAKKKEVAKKKAKKVINKSRISKRIRRKKLTAKVQK